MDFHAYAEVWLEGGWHVFDPHDNLPRKGRVFIASGLDAADAAFATFYGAARLTRIEVHADPVNERGEKINLALPKKPGPAANIVQMQFDQTVELRRPGTPLPTAS